MGFEEPPKNFLASPRNGTSENFLEDFESEEQVVNFILQPARESCRKMFTVGLSSFTGKLAGGESVKTLTDGIFLKSTFKQRTSKKEKSINCCEGFVESKEQIFLDREFSFSSLGTSYSSSSSDNEDFSNCSVNGDSSSCSVNEDSSSCSVNGDSSSCSVNGDSSSCSVNGDSSSCSVNGDSSSCSDNGDSSSCSVNGDSSSCSVNKGSSSCVVNGDSSSSSYHGESSGSSYHGESSGSSYHKESSGSSHHKESSVSSDNSYNSSETKVPFSSPDPIGASRNLEAMGASSGPAIKDAQNSPDTKNSFRSPDALQKMVRSILSSAVKCETDDQNNNLVITSHWCEICLVYDPNGANKHMEYHIAPTKLFLKRVLGYEEIMHNYGSHSQSQQLPLCILEACAINLVHFNCVFEKGLMLMQNNIIYKQKRWLNLLLLEVLDFTSSIRKFKISDIRNLPSFGDDGGFMMTRLLCTEEGDSTLFSYVNAVAEFVKLLQYITNKSFYSFNVLFESKLTEQEVEVLNFLKRTEKLSNILTIFIKGWRESLKPKREIEIQATEMLSMDLWLQMLDSVVGLDLGILLTSFGSFMASYHGGNISKAGIQAILLLISDMLNTLLPDLENTVEFKFEYLQYLHVAFFPGGWLDLALRQPCFNYNNSVCLPILGVNKFLMFLEILNWYGEYSLNLDLIYKTIHGLCFPTYNFDVFKLKRL